MSTQVAQPSSTSGSLERIPELGPLFEAAPMALVVVDEQGRILTTNRKLEALFGYAPGELRERSIEILLPVRLRALHIGQREQFREDPHERPMGSGMDLCGRRKDGTALPIEAGLGLLGWHGQTLTVVTVTDLTQRKKVEADLERRVAERTRELERRRRVADGLRDILAVLNSQRPLPGILEVIVAQTAMLLEADRTAIFRVTEDEDATLVLSAGGLPTDDAAPPAACRDTVRHAIAERAPRVELDGGPGCQHRALLAAPILMRGTPVGALLLTFPRGTSINDEAVALSETVADQVALAIENAEAQEAAQRDAVAAERNRIARDLHDSVTQMLFSATLIADVLPRLWQRDESAGHARLAELRQLCRGALSEMRMLLLELRPSVLREVPLPKLLQQLADAFTARARVPVELAVVAPAELPPDVVEPLYRIAQEALHNIARHAAATQASIGLHEADGVLRMTIADDGCGFVPEAVDAGHMGLSIMHERAASIHADLAIQTAPAEGTLVQITWRRDATGSGAASHATDTTAAGAGGGGNAFAGTRAPNDARGA